MGEQGGMHPARLWMIPILLLAVSPSGLWCSQQVRMYSLTAMLVLAAMAACLRLLRDDTLPNWAAYGLLSLRKRPQLEQHRVALVVWFVLPLLLTSLISLGWLLPQETSIYMGRFFNPFLPSFLILVAFGLLRLLSAGKSISSLAIVVLLSTVRGSLCSAYYDVAYVQGQWRNTIAEIKTSTGPDDLLLVRSHHYVPSATTRSEVLLPSRSPTWARPRSTTDPLAARCLPWLGMPADCGR